MQAAAEEDFRGQLVAAPLKHSERGVSLDGWCIMRVIRMRGGGRQSPSGPQGPFPFWGNPLMRRFFVLPTRRGTSMHR